MFNNSLDWDLVMGLKNVYVVSGRERGNLINIGYVISHIY